MLGIVTDTLFQFQFFFLILSLFTFFLISFFSNIKCAVSLSQAIINIQDHVSRANFFFCADSSTTYKMLCCCNAMY